MPEMGGQELATPLAEVRPGQKVLFTSGYTDGTLRLGGLSGIAAHFIGKPYSAADLARGVRDVLDHDAG